MFTCRLRQRSQETENIHFRLLFFLEFFLIIRFAMVRLPTILAVLATLAVVTASVSLNSHAIVFGEVKLQENLALARDVSITPVIIATSPTSASSSTPPLLLPPPPSSSPSSSSSSAAPSKTSWHYHLVLPAGKAETYSTNCLILPAEMSDIFRCSPAAETESSSSSRSSPSSLLLEKSFHIRLREEKSKPAPACDYRPSVFPTPETASVAMGANATSYDYRDLGKRALVNARVGGEVQPFDWALQERADDLQAVLVGCVAGLFLIGALHLLCSESSSSPKEEENDDDDDDDDCEEDQLPAASGPPPSTPTSPAPTTPRQCSTPRRLEFDGFDHLQDVDEGEQEEDDGDNEEQEQEQTEEELQHYHNHNDDDDDDNEDDDEEVYCRRRRSRDVAYTSQTTDGDDEVNDNGNYVVSQTTDGIGSGGGGGGGDQQSHSPSSAPFDGAFSAVSAASPRSSSSSPFSPSPKAAASQDYEAPSWMSSAYMKTASP